MICSTHAILYSHIQILYFERIYVSEEISHSEVFYPCFFCSFLKSFVFSLSDIYKTILPFECNERHLYLVFRFIALSLFPTPSVYFYFSYF